MNKTLTSLLIFITAAGGLQAQTSMTLRQCIEHATARNVDVKLQENTVRSQEVSLNTSRNAWMPNVDAGVSQNFNFGRALSAQNVYVDRNTYTTSLSVGASMPLFTGGRITAQRKQAALNLQAATADLARLRENLSLQVAQAYLEVLCQQDFCTKAEEQLVLSRHQLERLESLARLGKAAGVELSQARSVVAQDELALVENRNAARMAQLSLSQLIEMPSPDSLNIINTTRQTSHDITGTPQSIYEEALCLRPEIEADSLRIQSAEQGIRAARSSYWPSLSLNAGLGTSYYKSPGFDSNPFGRQLKDNFSKYVGLSLSIPLFDRFSTRNNVRQARIERESRFWQSEQTKKNLFKEIQQAWYNALSAREKLTASIAAEQAATDALTLTTRKFEAGKANTTEFEEARTKSLAAAHQRITAHYQYVFSLKVLDFYRGRPIE
ncbi:MAG: TolC family protein [Bacteroidaceae bacterium]|nr:TolC family protein [Bacteroidaceae bacterium]